MDKEMIGIIVTILIFLAGIIWNRRDQEAKQKDIRKRYLIALKEEIAINVKALEKSIALGQNTRGLEAFLKVDKKNRPIITYSYFSTVYATRTEVLQDLNEEVINGIVDFYGKLSELKTDIDGIESKAFETISDEGRLKCINVILEESKTAKQQGDDIIRLIGVVINHKNIRAG